MRRRAVVAGWLALGCLLAVDVLAQVPHQPGWPVDQGAGMEAGVRAALNHADVDGDGHIEIVAGSRDGRLYVWRSDGTLLPGWPFQTGSYMESSPAVGDLDGDGACEIVASSNDGNLYVLSARGVPLDGWPKSLDWSYAHEGGSHNQCAPVLFDVDRDGSLDIVYNSSLTSCTHVFDRSGRELPGWPQGFGDAEWSRTTSIVTDLDGDGAPEIVTGVAYTWEPPNHNALYAWHADGTLVDGWPVILETYWFSPFGSIASADVDGNGTADVVATDPLRVYALDGTGGALPGWPVELDYDLGGHHVALADLDGDEKVEVVVGSTQTGRLRALDDDGQVMLSMPVGSIGPPALADVNGDGAIDIIAGLDYPLRDVIVVELDGGVAGWLGLPTPGHVFGPPIVLDLDADGTVEVGAADYGFDVGRLHAFVWDLPSTFDAHKAPWPMYQHDAAHTGWLAPHAPVVPPPAPDLDWALASPRPNPSRGHATFDFAVPRAARVRLEIFDLSGRCVKPIEDRSFAPGRYSRGWDGSDETGAPVPDGVYFARLWSAGVVRCRKAVLSR